jgi:hypothetical protein
MGCCRNTFVMAALATCSLGTLPAQPGTDTKNLTGNWVYRLGPNTFLALHLETENGNPNRLRGYLLHPEHFNLNSPGGSLLKFSNITNQSQRESIISNGWQDGLLRLEDASSNKPGDRDVYLVRLVDATHIDFTLFQPLPSLRMERTTDQPQLADTWDSARTYTPDDFVADNPQMAQIVAADQADRKDPTHIDAKKLTSADDGRRNATAVLVREGKLHTGHDFESAALVFQHGKNPDDYLLAHALAMVAISKGQSEAVWISAATLDRYLQSIHQPQIFGTQFRTLGKEPTTQEPYNRNLVSDALRGYMGVPNQAAQETQKHQYDLQRGIGMESSGSATR